MPGQGRLLVHQLGTAVRDRADEPDKLGRHASERGVVLGQGQAVDLFDMMDENLRLEEDQAAVGHRAAVLAAVEPVFIAWLRLLRELNGRLPLAAVWTERFVGWLPFPVDRNLEKNLLPQGINSTEILLIC